MSVSLNQKVGWWPTGFSNPVPSPSIAGVIDISVVMPGFLWGFGGLKLMFWTLSHFPFLGGKFYIRKTSMNQYPSINYSITSTAVYRSSYVLKI